MDYDNLLEYEVINEILRANPAHKSPKQIAAHLGRSVVTVYKWGENPENSGAAMPKDYILPFSNFTQDKRLIEWYAHHHGYHLCANGPIITNGDLFDQLLNMDKLRGVFAQELVDARKDGVITSIEARKLRDVLSRLADETRIAMAEIDELEEQA